jgi:hypothetical protein
MGLIRRIRQFFCTHREWATEQNGSIGPGNFGWIVVRMESKSTCLVCGKVIADVVSVEWMHRDVTAAPEEEGA